MADETVLNNFTKIIFVTIIMYAMETMALVIISIIIENSNIMNISGEKSSHSKTC